MGSNVNNATSEGHEDTMFNSKDIVGGTKAGQKKEYFVKVKDKTAGQKFSEWFHRNTKKIFITMCAVVLVALAAFIVIQIIANSNQPKEVEWGEEISSTEDEINKYLEEIQDSDSETPYSDTVAHFEETYDAETDPDKKFALLIAQIRFLTGKSDYDEAEKLIFYASMPDLDDEQKYIFAVAAYELYIEKEDQEMIDYYYGLIEEMPDEAKSKSGGGA
ncbi:hypothetical protein IJI94_01095 [Candidatus Saccharibacteria bacterium]|nr:hypothetical protein [Candidatus Saccharibacteria bacterium]